MLSSTPRKSASPPSHSRSPLSTTRRRAPGAPNTQVQTAEAEALVLIRALCAWVSGYPRVLHKASKHSAGQCEWAGGESVGWMVDFRPVLFSIQLTLASETWAFKSTWRNQCCQPDADSLPRGLRSCRRRSKMTSAQLNLHLALSGKPGQSCDVGGRRLSWVLW